MCDDIFPYVFVTLPYGGLGKVRYLIALIPDLCLLNFYEEYKVSTLKLNQDKLKLKARESSHICMRYTILITKYHQNKTRIYSAPVSTVHIFNV